MSFLNGQAQALLGISASDCVGRPCHRVIDGKNAAGDNFCQAQCPIIRRARNNEGLEPVRMRVSGPDGESRWIEVVTIATSGPDDTGPWLVHCALSADGARRIEEYITKVALRTPGAARLSVLSTREAEILKLLAEDENAHSIAAKLHLSHATVRNHVQHLMAKLGVHSTIEAVARCLLARDET